jgi:hypothetical protein
VTGIAIPHPVLVLADVHMCAAIAIDRNGIGRRSPRRRMAARSMLPMRLELLGRGASGGLA